MTIKRGGCIQILRSVQQVRQWQLECFLRRESVGFVPTMGALHQGHCSLVGQSLKENDRTVVSIFVNPSQFAPHEDLDVYPRTLDSDMEKLESFETKTVDAVFIPKVTEMYPSGINLDVGQQRGAFVSVLGCSEQLEGAQRPQFFRGVATIVTKLLNVVKPTRVYFGQKDAQQCVVIRNLVKDLLIDTKVRVLPTMREPNGLALSSRNAYLSQDLKDKCSVIYKALKQGQKFYNTQSKISSVKAADITNEINSVLENGPLQYNLEYLAISHPETLEDLEIVEPGVGAVVSTALSVSRDDNGGKTRLLDCVILK